MEARRALIESLAAIFPIGARTTVDETVIARLAEQLRPLSHDDVEVVMAGLATSGQPTSYRGTAGLEAAWRDWLSSFERIELVVESVRARGDVVLAEVRQIGTTRHDAVEVEQPSAAVYRFHDGRLARIEFHLDRRAAARSAGLSGPHA